jgi:hypothetical protein
MNHPKISLLNDEEQSKWVLCQNKDKKRKQDYIFLGENEKIIYDSKARMDHNLSEYIVGVYSKKKREMTFVDIESIFSMNQKVRRIEEYNSKMEQQMNKKLLEEINSVIEKKEEGRNYLENKLQLIKDFGTQKAKKVAINMKSHIVDEENISSINAAKRILEDNAIKQKQEVDMTEEEQQQKKISNWKKIMPEFNLETDKVDEIFNLDSSILFVIKILVIESTLLEQIEIDSITENMKTEDFDSNKFSFSDFTFCQLKKYQKYIQNGTANIPYKIKAYVFLDYMIRFHLLPKIIKSNVEIISKENNIDSFFVNLLLEKFSENSFHLEGRAKNVKTPTLQLKIIYHILILALILSKYKLDITRLAKSMKMDIKQLQSYAKEIGCKLSEVKKEKNKKGSTLPGSIVELVAPLKLNLEHNKYNNK